MEVEKQAEKIKKQQEEDLAKKRAESHNLPYLNLSTLPLHAEALSIVDKEKARDARAAIIQKTGSSVSAAVENPNNPKTQALLEELQKTWKQVKIFVVSESSLESAWNKYPEKEAQKTDITGAMRLSEVAIDESRKKITTIQDIEATLDEISKKNASEAFEALLGAAFAMDATDIHIEPQQKTSVVRIKVDGILYKAAELEQRIYDLVLSRIKLLSELKLNIHDRPQEGRFSIIFEERQIEIRTSVLPAEYNEDIALRILDPKFLLSMEELGLRKDLEKILKEKLGEPQGLVLATGPTGSGKTTTLYAGIKYLKTPEVKIITIEDPIEYHLSGITQTQITEDENYTFESGLKAILRQDPDIVLISELRNIDAAESAIQAALAGRRVLSTLHTIDAAGTAPRLADMGVDASTVASALSASVAQRLVRKLCENCKKKKRLSEDEYQKISEVLKKMPQDAEVPEIKKSSFIYHPSAGGCAECHNTGYKGRTGIFEIMEATKEIKEEIMKHPTEDELRDFATGRGMTSIRQDGVLKVVKGITSLEEIKRILG